MKPKPILFNTDMVRALLGGHKTVTRRVVKGQFPEWNFVELEENPYMAKVDKNGEEYPSQVNGLWATFSDGLQGFPMVKTPYRPGDILYVRETFFKYAGEYVYRASVAQPDLWDNMWHPSIHMPREAARIFLRVTGVRVERLQDITHDEIAKEGILTKEPLGSPQRVNPYFAFKNVWNSTIKPADRDVYRWDANPWVWVIAFERCEKPE